MSKPLNPARLAQRPAPAAPASAGRRWVPVGSLLAAAVLVVACGGKSGEELAAAGQAAMAQKDYAAAVIQYKSALQKEPESAAFRLGLGLALLESGDPVSARVELEKAQELQSPDEQVIPPLARALMLVGDETRLLAQYGQTRLNDPKAQSDLLTSLAAAHLMRGDTQRGQQLADEALRLQPGFSPAVVLTARLKASEGNFDGALGLLDQVLARDAADERAGVFRGEVLWVGKRDRDAALASFRSVLQSNPRSVAAHTSTIAILNELNQRDEARAQLATMRKVAPSHPDTIFFDAQFAFVDGDFAKSRELTDRLLKGAPNSPRINELAGAADFRRGRFSEAEAFLARALKGAPNRLLARQLLAQTYLRTNQPAKAVEVLQPVAEGNTPDATSLALVGEAYMQLGEARKADAAFAAAQKRAPDDPRIRTTAALAELARGNNTSAIAKLEAVAAEDKGTRADLALVSARLRANDTAGALKAIDNIEKKQPDAPLAYQLRGRVQLLQKDIAGATRSFETALAKDGSYFPAIASLAAIDLDAKRPEDARKRFQDHLRAQPKAFQAHLALAELAARTGGEPDVITGHLRDAVKTNAGEAQSHLMLVSQLLGSGDTGAALTAAREAAAALPGNVPVAEALGRAQMAANDAASAVTTFKQLTTQQPGNPLFHVRLAEALVASKDNASARRSLEKALELRPGFAPARRSLVGIAMAEGKPQEALALAREMQKADPKDAGAFVLEGDIEAARRSWEPAITAYRTAFGLARTTDHVVRLHMAMSAGGRKADADRLGADWSRENPKDVGFRFYQGDLALGQGDFAAAEAHYRAVAEAQPRNALALNNIAYLMVKQNKPGSLEMAQKANDLLPGRPQLMDTLALALAANKKLPQAIELQKSAVARAPNDGGLKLTLARLLIQAGDKAYARAELEDLAKQGTKFRDHAEVERLLKTL